MKRLILGILVISYPLLLAGQMFPLSDQYVSNPLPVNPAFAGCHDALSAAVSFRNQWIGFSDAPRNYMLSVHTPVWHDKIGLGLMIDKYSVGIFRETSIIGNYAYRIRLSDGKLALGLGFGLISYKSAWNELQATDPNDIQLPDNAATGLVPSFSLGTYYYTRKYFIGFSVPYFLNYDVDQKSGTFKVSNFFSVANYCLTGGYE